jgi:hypothetical protein
MKKVASHKSMRKKEQVTSHDNVMKGGQGQEIHLHYVNHPLLPKSTMSRLCNISKFEEYERSLAISFVVAVSDPRNFRNYFARYTSVNVTALFL